MELNMVRVVNRYFYTIIFGILLCFSNAYSSEKVNHEEILNDKSLVPTKFITFGHTRTILKDPQKRELFINYINSEDAEYVFVLGDASAWREEIASEYVSKIKAEVYFAPGNHDLKKAVLFGEDRRSKYIKSVGYFEKTIVTNDCNFVLVNSSENIEHINNFLDTSLPKTNPSNVTILLAHHRVWDDNLLSELPYEHDKSYYFSELLPHIDGKADYIFAGNSPSQYFKQEKTKANREVVYWCDIVNGIECYSNGMTGNTISYLVVEVVGKNLVVSPRSFPLSKSEIKKPGWWRSKFRKDSLWHKLLTKTRHKVFWFGFIIGILSIVPFTLKFVFSGRSNGRS